MFVLKRVEQALDHSTGKIQEVKEQYKSSVTMGCIHDFLDKNYLHVQALGFLDKRRRHRQEDDVRIKVVRAVVGVKALDARLVHFLDDGGNHIETS